MAYASPQTLLRSTSGGAEFAFELVEDDAHSTRSGDDLDATGEQCGGCTGCASGCQGCSSPDP